MNKTDLINCLNKITPSNSEKKEMFDYIMSTKNEEPIPVKRTVKKLSAAAIALIMICVLIATTASAFYFLGWHEKLMEYLSASNEQIVILEPAVSHPEVCVTKNGVTITVKQTLTDVRGIYALYEILLPEGVTADEAYWRMTNLAVQTEERPKGADFGSLSSNTLDSTGNKLTMLIFLKQEGYFGDGTAILDLCDLTLYADGVLNTIEGIWHLEWPFVYDDANSIEIPIHRQVALGEESIYINRISISPTSICIFGKGDIGLFDKYGYPIVNLSDGSQINYGEQISSNSYQVSSDSFISMTDMNESGAGQMELYYRFDRIINLDEIISVTIGTETIILN